MNKGHRIASPPYF